MLIAPELNRISLWQVAVNKKSANAGELLASHRKVLKNRCLRPVVDERKPWEHLFWTECTAFVPLVVHLIGGSKTRNGTLKNSFAAFARAEMYSKNVTNTLAHCSSERYLVYSTATRTTATTSTTATISTFYLLPPPAPPPPLYLVLGSTVGSLGAVLGAVWVAVRGNLVRTLTMSVRTKLRFRCAADIL